MPFYFPVFSPFIQRGNCGVDVFMFLSGFCLCLSLQRNNNLENFFSKRFIRVVVPYLIIAVPFFIWKCFEEFSSKRLAHFFYDLSGLSFWFSGCLNAWFVHAIIAFYFITPLFFSLVKIDIRYALISVVIIYFLNFYSFYFVPFYKLSSIAFMRLPIFLVGMILAYNNPHFDFSNRKTSVILFLLLGLLCLLFIPIKSVTGFYSWFLYGFIVIPLLWVLASAFERLPKIIRPLFSSIGDLSLELYLSHIMFLHIIRFYKVEHIIGYWMYFILPFLAIFYSLVAANMSKRISNNILKICK